MRRARLSAPRRAAGVWASILVLGLLEPSASGQDRKSEARQQSDQGTIEYSLGHYEAAVEHYEEAYRLVQDAGFLYNIAQAHRLAKANERALNAYRAYLRIAADDAPNRELAQKRIEELEALRGVRLDARSAALPVVEQTTFAPVASTSSTEANASEAGAPLVERPTHHRYWAWAVAGAVLAGCATALVVVLGSRDQGATPGSAGTVTIR